MRGLAVLAGISLTLAACTSGGGAPSSAPVTPSGSGSPISAASHLPSGRALTPAGRQVDVGNYPTGGALTADGRYLWTVSAGFSSNDVRIVDTSSGTVCQVVEVPGASGGVALDSAHRLAYVSGLANTRWQPTKNGLPGVKGDVVQVISWTDTCGGAKVVRTIAVPPQPNPPTQQSFPPPGRA